MNIIENRTIYKCDFCRKTYLTKGPCERHEKYCGKNPDNKHACFHCIHLAVDRNQNDDGFSEKTFNCVKLEKELHTFKAEKIKHSCLGHTERMPLVCESLEVESYISLSVDF
jgi:hypothetical protein